MTQKQEKNLTGKGEEPAETSVTEENENLPRVFVYNGNEFADPLPGESPDTIMKMLAGNFPELANGECTEEVKDDKRVIRFRKKATVNG